MRQGIPLRSISYEPATVLPGGAEKVAGEPRRLVRSISPEDAKVAAGPRIAILTLHGMGQQVPFETLEQVAVGLGKADGQQDPQLTATNCAFDEMQVRRLELRLKDSPRNAEIHLYKAYWAPITEGQVKLKDVVVFLARDTWRALWEAPTPFIRWMFDKTIEFKKPLRSILGLVAALLVLGILAVLNAVVPLVVASRFQKGLPPSQVPAGFLIPFTLMMDVMLSAIALTMILLGVARGLKRRHPAWKAVRRLVEQIALVALLIDLAAIIALPFSALALWLRPAWFPLLSADTASSLVSPTGLTATWLALMGLTLIIRRFLVQYVGDVAAYVSPQFLDRFAEIRRKITDEVCKIAHAIMSARAPDGTWEYERVAFVGHSLGSVIAYDAVNRAMTDDILGITNLKILERLRVLVTFGSPLDKTALIFGLHGKHAGLIREQLAARVQPLIEDYANRLRLTWINVFSPFDIISGSLDYYDDEADPRYPDLRVQNQLDDEARIPLVAHTEYWENSRVWRLLHSAVR